MVRGDSDSARVPRLPLPALVFVLVASAAHAVTLDVPAISGTIASPEGYVFEGIQLKINWFCIEASHFPMSPTGQKDCGGLGSKEGTHLVDIRPDGGFETQPIKVARRSVTRNPRFFLRFSLLKDGASVLGTGDGYQRRYSTDEEGDVTERLRGDLGKLRLVRVRGGRLPVRVEAREDGVVDHFNALMERYPRSYNYNPRLILWIGKSGGGFFPIPVSAEVKDSEVSIEDFVILQIGSENSVPMNALIEAQIGLVREEGDYSYYNGDVKLNDLVLEVDADLEARLPADLFADVEILLEIDSLDAPDS